MPNPAKPADKPAVIKKVVRKERVSMTKLMLRWAYWLIILAVVGVVGFVIFEAAWIWYSNTRA
jgi:cell division septal protein FtsQ